MIQFIRAKVNRKLAAMCILLAVMICVGCCISGYLQYRESAFRSYNDFAYEIDEIARTYVDGDRITSYLTEPADAAYDEMAKNIYNLYSNTSLKNYQSGIYICIPDAENLTITNLYDVRIHDADEETRKYFEIGVTDPMGIAHPEHAIAVFTTGERSDDYFVHKTKFGYNSSAMLPVKNSAGEIVALIVTDMPMPYLEDTLTRFLFIIVLLTALIVAIFIAAFLFVVHERMTKPLTMIARETERFSRTGTAAMQPLPSAKQPDEIGQLASGIFAMENDIRTYMENLTAVTAEKERIGAELDVATQIQASMLPCIFPAFPERKEIEIYAMMTPAKEVGGDFYDFFMVDESHLAMVIADVSGKGVPAALFMVIGKTLIKDHTQLGSDLGDVFSQVNDLLCEANSQGLFITAFEGILDLRTGDFSFVNAGHEMPFVYRRGEAYTPQKIRPGFVLAGMEGMRYRAGSFKMEAGDKLFLYTDGVTEATNAENQLYGMQRLEYALNRCKTISPEQTLREVKADVDQFVGEAPQFDDITMLCVEYKKQMN